MHRQTSLGIVLIIAIGVSIALQANLFARSPQSESSVQYANEISKQISTQEWLGPLASVALSPFFGLTCLSGAATYGPDWLRERSVLFSANSPMNNPFLFWTMSILTIITSLPRFTKLSKPIALLAENVEAYSAIIILVVMKFASSSLGSSANETISTPGFEDPLFQAGVLAYSSDLILSIAAAVNLIVINTIKLGMEFVIWLIPVPFIDSALEIFNKLACASLAALYAYSPFLASCLNLAIFALCAMIFLQVMRYLRYFKYLYLYPVLRAAMGFNEATEKTISGFTQKRWKNIPARSELRLAHLTGDRFDVTYPSWVSSQPLGIAGTKDYKPGLLVDTLILTLDGVTIELDVRKGIAGNEAVESTASA